MTRPASTEVIVVGFDYRLLDTKVADKVQAAAGRIRDKLKQTINNIIEVGYELRAVKEALPHGRFLSWLRAEFGWSVRTARNFMSVAEQFGPKRATVAHLPIASTAAYLLAAPSVPEEAREDAVKRAENGEEITTKVAREILARAHRKKGSKKTKQLPAAKLAPRLAELLERYRERCDPADLPVLARQLREVAEAFAGPPTGRKRTAKR